MLLSTSQVQLDWFLIRHLESCTFRLFQHRKIFERLFDANHYIHTQTNNLRPKITSPDILIKGGKYGENSFEYCYRASQQNYTIVDIQQRYDPD